MLSNRPFVDLGRLIPFAGLRPSATAQALERFLTRSGSPLESGSVRDLLEGAIRFYQEARVRGLAGEDADMLLFQYGCYDWGGGEAFQLDMTRQFIASDRDRSMSQLRMTLYFAPRSDLRRLGWEEVWCRSSDEAAAFRQTVLANPAITVVGERPPLRRQIAWGPT